MLSSTARHRCHYNHACGEPDQLLAVLPVKFDGALDFRGFFPVLRNSQRVQPLLREKNDSVVLVLEFADHMLHNMTPKAQHASTTVSESGMLPARQPPQHL